MNDSLRLLVEQQNFPKLKELSEKQFAIKRDKNLLPLIAIANAQLGLGQAAREALLRAEAAQKEFDHATLVDLAGVYLLMQSPNKAAPLLEAAVQDLPSYGLALSRLAICRQQQGDAVSAQVLFRSAVAAEPSRVPVWVQYLRLVLNGLGSASGTDKTDQLGTVVNGLKQAFEQLDAQSPSLPQEAASRWHNQLSALQLELWVLQQEFTRAENWLEEQSQHLPAEALTELVSGYAAVLASHGQHDAAEESLRKALKQNPGHANLTLQLVELSRLQGHNQQAIALLLRAIEQDKENPLLWLRLSASFLHQNEERARKAAEKAMELCEALQPGPQYPAHKVHQLRLQAKLALAHVESDAQNFDLADKLYREVLKTQPNFLPALQGLGHQQLQRGNIDEAVALFEQVKAIDPVAGYTALINARKIPDDPAVLERLEKAAHMPSMEGSVRTGILYQLASAYEKRKDYDHAFALAVEANEANKKLLDYKPEVHRNRCARIRARFSKALFDSRKDFGSDATLPVFVLGMPRSGTTLIEQIIAGHSQVFGAGELSVIPQVIAGLERWERHTGSGRHYPDCVDDLTPEVVQGIANNVLKEMQAHDPQAKLVVDKLPHNFESIGLIKLLFPKARIISVRRDPRDIAMSNYFTDYQAKHGGMGFAYDMTWIGEQLADHNLLMHHWHQVFPGEILEINYEDVVENTEAMARKMLDYLGLGWEPQVLNTSELDRPVKTASVWQVRQPIYKTSKAKWMNYEKHLAPLIKGTNAKIRPEPVSDMVSLPVPGFLNEGVSLLKAENLDEAERNFKKLLHHVPEHAAANFLVGQIYVRKGHLQDGIELMEKAHKACPWNGNWRKDLAQAYELNGQPEQAQALRETERKARGSQAGDGEVPDADLMADVEREAKLFGDTPAPAAVAQEKP